MGKTGKSHIVVVIKSTLMIDYLYDEKQFLHSRFPPDGVILNDGLCVSECNNDQYILFIWCQM